ncbi:bifunctional riboflavin kinase/FMN phosphatase-like [Prunus yedoensis var. nudiflora]|uniref:Bifunctional riboflavin kinase/FMN phosphatase-like n=1 Tax=Prunus yedoensis var. nudiflora TaxID=2094558 RepID=A0A314Z8K8_PRUYE|nr:bifunctional riboflavin kinase/FMN phosphatase-like [Prunus yedoensis var. nudiflora]
MSCCDCASKHCNAEAPKPKILAVIFDLDGTLIDTAGYKGVFQEFLARYGKVLDKEMEEKKSLGKTLKDSATSVVKDYDLPLTPDQFIQEIIPMYQEKWLYTKALPGANRLIKHFHDCGVPIALASNSLREYIDAKISHHRGWKERFSVILGSDQVKAGKPSPDLFEEAAKQMGVDAVHCLVIEDSVVGVKAANAARMEVVAVPPRGEATCSSLANTVLHSLLEFQPERWGLPPFEDWVDNALPIEPIYFSGLYVNGFVSEVTEDGRSTLSDQVWGVFFGWAVADMEKTYRVVVGIGLDYSSCSPNKNIQIYTVDGNNCCISNQQMKLLLVGYIRGSNKEITSMDAETLKECKSIASASLDLPIFSHHGCVPLYPEPFPVEDMIGCDEIQQY